MEATLHEPWKLRYGVDDIVCCYSALLATKILNFEVCQDSPLGATVTHPESVLRPYSAKEGTGARSMYSVSPNGSIRWLQASLHPEKRMH